MRIFSSFLFYMKDAIFSTSHIKFHIFIFAHLDVTTFSMHPLYSVGQVRVRVRVRVSTDLFKFTVNLLARLSLHWIQTKNRVLQETAIGN